MISYFIEDKNGNLFLQHYYVGELKPTTKEEGFGKYVGDIGKNSLRDFLESEFSSYKIKEKGLKIVGYKNVLMKEI